MAGDEGAVEAATAIVLSRCRYYSRSPLSAYSIIR